VVCLLLLQLRLYHTLMQCPYDIAYDIMVTLRRLRVPSPLHAVTRSTHVVLALPQQELLCVCLRVVMQALRPARVS